MKFLLEHQINLPTEPHTILERLGKGDKTAVQDCIKTYGNFIWTLAVKHTGSLKEAEMATREIFLSIWRSARWYEAGKFNEAELVYFIAKEQLRQRLK